jgi:hypothetical protein
MYIITRLLKRNLHLRQWFPIYGSRTPWGFAEVFREFGKKCQKWCIFCLHNLYDKVIRYLVSFASAYVSQQSASVCCSLNRKITILNCSYVPCIISVGGSQDYIFYHEKGSRDEKVWETLLSEKSWWVLSLRGKSQIFQNDVSSSELLLREN